MPLYQLDILLGELGRVEARALRYAIQATSAPHLKASDHRALRRRLEKAASVPQPAAPTQAQPGTHDPAAAAAWFAARGVRVA